MRAFGLIAVAVLFAAEATSSARGQPPIDLASGITEDTVAVTSEYRGARLTVFGVSWRATGDDTDLVVVLRGPSADHVVRRKRRIFGLWLNTDPVRFSDTPTFYALASTRPVEEFLSPATIWALGLDPGALARLEGETPADSDPAAYRRGLVRLKRAAGLYRESPRGLVLRDNGAFTVPFIIPANAPIGDYRVHVYLFRDGRLLQQEPWRIEVNRIGVEKAIYGAAQTRPVLYGVATVLIALGFGWLAAAVFRRR